VEIITTEKIRDCANCTFCVPSSFIDNMTAEPGETDTKECELGMVLYVAKPCKSERPLIVGQHRSYN